MDSWSISERHIAFVKELRMSVIDLVKNDIEFKDATVARRPLGEDEAARVNLVA